jgi:4'-phosphopantetheinyl transferase EntD
MVTPPFFTSPWGNRFGFAIQTADESEELPLHPEEAQFLSPRAVPKRRREFSLGRATAHAALAQLQTKDYPILQGDKHEPIWPPGVVGSISHTDCIAMAAVAHRKDAAGIGIDIEQLDSQITWDIVPKICGPEEMDWVMEREDEKRIRFSMIFSAKEAVFKAFFPMEKIFLDFKDAVLTWSEQRKGFVGVLRKSPAHGYTSGYSFTVGCQRQKNYVFTYLALPPT